MRALRVTVICDALVRIEYSPTGRFCDWPSLFAANGPGGVFTVEADGVRSVQTSGLESADRGIDLQTARFHLTFKPDGKPLGPTNLRVWVRHAAPPADCEAAAGGVVWRPGSPNRHNLGGALETLDGVRGPVATEPGLLSRDGWFLLDDSRTYVMIDGWAHSRDELDLGGNTDWYLFAYGDDYAAAFSAFAIIAGGVPLPRRCALGSWYSRYWPYTSAEYRGIIADYDRHDFPLDVMVLDMDWHRDGWTGWSWNRSLLPDAEDLVSWLHEQRLAVTLNLHPADGVGSHEDAYPSFMRALGRDPARGERVPFDAGDRAYMAALFEQVHVPLEHPPGHPRAGVDFWWVDWQQDRFVRSKPGLTNLRWLNDLYFRHAQAKRIGVSSSAESSAAKSSQTAIRRGLGFSRWAGWGDHRHPIHFSGDSHTGWAMLGFAVPFTITSGNAGCFFWSHDIGGHFGPRMEETTARWVQFGAVSAALRLHSARSHVLDRRPWTYEPRFCDSMRRAFALRASLMPYIYSAAAESTRTTTPLLRPMYLDRSREERAYECPRQYLLGKDLLAAPIVVPGLRERCIATQRVWFPEGVWFNWFTGERHEAGEESLAVADIDEFPLFAAGGVPIPMQPPTLRPTSEPLRTLVVRVFPGESGLVSERSLYEDDGESQAWEHAGRAITPLHAVWSEGESCGQVRLELSIGPCEGSFEGQLERRLYVVQVGAAGKITDVRVDGVRIAPECPIGKSIGEPPEDIELPLEPGFTTVHLPARSIREAVHLTMIVEPTDPQVVRQRERMRHLEAAFGPVAAPSLKHAVLSQMAIVPENDAERRACVLAIGAGIALSRCGLDDRSHWRLLDSFGWIDGTDVQVQIVDRVGTTSHQERVIAEQTVGLSGPAAGRAATITLPDEPLAQPRLGLRADRIIRARFTIDREPVVIEGVAQSHLTPITRCLVAGPFDWHWTWSITEQKRGPETEPFDRAQGFQGIDGSRVRWRPGVRGERLGVDFGRAFEHRGLAYARSMLISGQPQRASLMIADGSDKIEVFLNGERVYVQDGFDAPSAANSAADVHLKAGPNDLLVKASECAGGWGFTIYLDGEFAVIDAEPGASSTPVMT